MNNLKLKPEERVSSNLITSYFDTLGLNVTPRAYDGNSRCYYDNGYIILQTHYQTIPISVSNFALFPINPIMDSDLIMEIQALSATSKTRDAEFYKMFCSILNNFFERIDPISYRSAREVVTAMLLRVR